VAKKTAKNDRRAVIDDIRKKQKGAERARGLAIVGVCGVIAVAIVGAAAFNPIKNSIQTSAYDDSALQDIGESTSAAGCQDVVKRQADGNQSHETTGTQITYSTAPPAFGPHWNEANIAPAAMSRKFYTVEDRPELESLVHNLEHGYTILWYDDTVADDDEQMSEIRAIADKFAGTSNWRYKFIAAPWSAADQEETTVKGDEKTQFPEGTHVAFTHWSIGGTNGPGLQDATKQQGIFQYCESVSGEALKSFMKAYPYTDSPEPNAM